MWDSTKNHLRQRKRSSKLLEDGHIYAIFFNIKLLVQFHSIGQFFCNLKELIISIKVFFPSNVKKGNLPGPTLILIFFNFKFNF